MDDADIDATAQLFEAWAAGRWNAEAEVPEALQRLIVAAKKAVTRARDEELTRAHETEKAIDVAADSLGRLVIQGDLTQAAISTDSPSLGLAALYEAVNQSARLLREFVQAIKVAATELGTGSRSTHQLLDESAQVLNMQATTSQGLAATLLQLDAASGEIARSATTVAALSKQSQLASMAGSTAVQDFSVLMSEVEENAASVATAVDSLSRSVQQIDAVIQLITEVADRSDMLALNAALEAARAGSAGKGFAIVADEMRRLSARVIGNASDVSTLITAVRQATEKVRERAGANIEVAANGHARAIAALQNLGGIIAAVEETASAAELISHATGQQRSATTSAARAISELSDDVQQVAAGTAKTLSSAERVASVSTWMEKLVQRFFVGG